MKNPVLPETFSLPIVSPPAPTTPPAPVALTPTTPQAPVDESQSDLDLDACADRESGEGVRYDAAILQALREHVWGVLSRRENPESVAKIYPLIISGRKQTMAERTASGASPIVYSQRQKVIIDQLINPELKKSLPNASATPPETPR